MPTKMDVMEQFLRENYPDKEFTAMEVCGTDKLERAVLRNLWRYGRVEVARVVILRTGGKQNLYKLSTPNKPKGFWVHWAAAWPEMFRVPQFAVRTSTEREGKK